MKKIWRKHKKIVISGLVIITTLSATLTYTYSRRHHRYSAAGLATTTPHNAKQQQQANLKTLTVLLLGYGGAGHQGGFLTDVIQLIHIDFDKAQVAMISIPRDLWVKLANGKQAKVNAAFTLGENPNQPVASGGQVAKEMITTITGLPIDYFVAINFVGFKRAIGEELGGIEVDVPETLDDPWYPIQGKELDLCGMTPVEVTRISSQYSGFELEKQFECRYEQLHFEPGLTHMEGGDALQYVRSRHGSAAGDFSRSQRQQVVLKAIRDKLLSLRALDDIPSFFSRLSQHTTSDVNLEIAEYLGPAFRNIGQFETKSIVLSTNNVLTSSRSDSRQSILVPKNSWVEVINYVQQQLP